MINRLLKWLGLWGGEASPPDPSGPPVRFKTLPNGYAGTVMVIDEMRMLAREAQKDERTAQLARKIVALVPERDEAGEARAILAWMRANFRYTGLPWVGERESWQRLTTPAYTLFDAPTRAGECASLSTAMAALLMSVGREVKFRTAGQDPSQPRDMEHVYALVKIGDDWVAADPSYPHPLGWPHRSGDESPARTWIDWSL